ncbi:MAG: hypothetical protein CML29_05320 [Rhizobiales bacterium]|nr:hypothetical protein [Hyphomicrobiales bacterium]MBA70514.1 hypothetical protein [Hyphomicrobiales bacterium]
MEDHSQDTAHYPPVDPVSVGLRGRCPRCGEGAMFDGLLSVKDRCTNCKLDYSFADAGDGPAVFVIMIVGFIVVGFAMWLEINYSPPVWLQALIWLPVASVLCLAGLRMLKGVLIALQYRNKAAEGRIDRG